MRTALTLALLTFGVAIGDARADEAATPDVAAIAAPAYQAMRQGEDWGVLGTPGYNGKADLFDPIKYIAIGRDSGVWLSLGGQARVRLESIRNAGFGGPPGNDDTYALNRVFLHADLHVGENLRVFTQVKSATTTDYDLFDSSAGPAQRDDLALQTAFLELTVPAGDATLRFRGGRQELPYGRERLATGGEWDNPRLTFDGVTGRIAAGDWSVEGFWARPVKVRPKERNHTDGARMFWGTYAQRAASRGALDVYYMGLSNDAGSFNGTAGREVRHTVGSRIAGPIGGSALDYDLEGAYQFGRVDSRDVSAFMVSSELGWAVGAPLPKTRLILGLDYASGDDRPGGDVETFNQLFNDGHAYFGFVDTVGRQNVVSAKLGASAQPTDRLSVWLTGFYFGRADDNDAFYNPGGAAVRTASGGSSEIGFETDLGVRFQFDRHLVVELQYNRFYTGEFIRETGADDDIDAVYATVQYTF